jgi:HSP20 family protein
MRYRRLSYGYALVVSGRPPEPPSAIRLAPTVWNPRADVYETAGEVRVTIELPGVDLDDLDVLVFDDALIVQGQRRLPQVGERGRYVMAQIRQGPFRIELGLPARIDPERVDGRIEQGLLQITVGKASR